jgi:hypothetical protein
VVVSAHSLFALCDSWNWLLFVLSVLCFSVILFFFSGSNSEVMNAHDTKMKEVNNKWEGKTIQEVERNPNVSRNETVNFFVLPLSLLSNIILWTASIHEEESWCGPYYEKQKNLLN